MVVVPDADTAVRVAARAGGGGPISVWARDRAKGERVARRLPSTTTWVGRHGLAPTSVPVRLARHTVARQLEWRAAWAPGTPTLPVDPSRVAIDSSLAEVRHGRESRRWPALRALARREAVSRPRRAGLAVQTPSRDPGSLAGRSRAVAGRDGMSQPSRAIDRMSQAVRFRHSSQAPAAILDVVMVARAQRPTVDCR